MLVFCIIKPLPLGAIVTMYSVIVIFHAHIYMLNNILYNLEDTITSSEEED